MRRASIAVSLLLAAAAVAARSAWRDLSTIRLTHLDDTTWTFKENRR